MTVAALAELHRAAMVATHDRRRACHGRRHGRRGRRRYHHRAAMVAVVIITVLARALHDRSRAYRTPPRCRHHRAAAVVAALRMTTAAGDLLHRARSPWSPRPSPSSPCWRARCMTVAALAELHRAVIITARPVKKQRRRWRMPTATVLLTIAF